jgi:hypothetical protein
MNKIPDFTDRPLHRNGDQNISYFITGYHHLNVVQMASAVQLKGRGKNNESSPHNAGHHLVTGPTPE